MSRVEPRRDLLNQIGEVPMDVTTKKFVDVETLAIKIREQRRAFLPCGLEKDVDEERTAGKLLHDQIARGFTRRDLLTPRDMFHQFRSFGRIEFFEPEDVKPLEITLCIVCRFENLAA